jgi:hypothetical protein
VRDTPSLLDQLIGVRFNLWTNMTLGNFAMGSVTTLTVVALIGDVGRDHVAVATSRESPQPLTYTMLMLYVVHMSLGRSDRSSASRYRAL